MKAWSILTHSLRQISGNLPAAIRVTALPFLVVVLAMGLFIAVGVQVEGGKDTPAGFAIGALVGFVIVLVVMSVAAINWHRHVLLNEPVGWVPQIRRDRIGPYMLTAIGISLIFMVVFGCIGLVAYMLGVIGIIIAIPLFLLALVASLRASTALPGRALGADVGISGAMAATAGATGTLAAFTVIYVLFSILVGFAAGFLSMIPFLGVFGEIAVNWFNTMLGLSILTTLYGHYVEGRELV